MTVTLTPEQQKFIAERMSRGEYSSPEKIVDEGLKLIQAKEQYQGRLVELRRELQIGVDQLNRGEVLDGKEVIDRLLEKKSATGVNAQMSRIQFSLQAGRDLEKSRSTFPKTILTLPID
jgi:antitoxin ParD1/3/4